MKVKVAAPAVEGKANEGLLKIIAEKLGIHRRDIRLMAGEKSRDKVVAVASLEPEEARSGTLA